WLSTGRVGGGASDVPDSWLAGASPETLMAPSAPAGSRGPTRWSTRRRPAPGRPRWRAGTRRARPCPPARRRAGRGGEGGRPAGGARSKPRAGLGPPRGHPPARGRRSRGSRQAARGPRRARRPAAGAGGGGGARGRDLEGGHAPVEEATGGGLDTPPSARGQRPLGVHRTWGRLAVPDEVNVESRGHAWRRESGGLGVAGSHRVSSLR